MNPIEVDKLWCEWIQLLAAAPRSIRYPYGEQERAEYERAWHDITKAHNEYRKAKGLPI